MNKNLNLFTTLVLVIGLIVPTGAHAAGFLDNVTNWFGASFGATVGYKVGEGVAHHAGEMIPQNFRKPLAIAVIVGIVGLIIYANYEKSSNKNKRKNQRAQSCANQGCSHKKCK